MFMCVCVGRGVGGGIMMATLLLGLPRLRNFVNVYTISRNRNDSVYTQLPY